MRPNDGSDVHTHSSAPSSRLWNTEQSMAAGSGLVALSLSEGH
jgi:hypothetical protein